MIRRLHLRLYVWLLDRGILTVHPEDDPRRSPADRLAWKMAGRKGRT